MRQLATQQLEAARSAQQRAGCRHRIWRSRGDAPDRHGLKAGTSLSEHQNPGEATIFVLRGSLWLRSGGESWQGKTGDLLIIPNGLHSLDAEEDSAFLMTVAKITS